MHLMPSGVAARRTSAACSAQGMVIDPAVLLEEIDELEQRGAVRRDERFIVSRARVPGLAAPRADRRLREQRGARRDRHDQARHRPGVRRQGRAPRHAHAAICVVARAVRAQAGRARTSKRRQPVLAALGGQTRRRSTEIMRALRRARRAARAADRRRRRCVVHAAMQRGSTCCSRARRARCSTSITARIRS